MLKNLVPIPMLALLSAPVYAAGGHDHGSHSKGDKGFYSHVDIKIHFDRIVDAEEASEEFDEAYTHSHMELGMRLNSKLSINANIKIEGEPAGHHHGHGHGEEEEEHHEEEDQQREVGLHHAKGPTLKWLPLLQMVAHSLLPPVDRQLNRTGGGV